MFPAQARLAQLDLCCLCTVQLQKGYFAFDLVDIAAVLRNKNRVMRHAEACVF